MSDSNPQEQTTKTKRSVGVRILRGAAWTVLGLVMLLIVVVVGLSWYSRTADFQNRVAKELVGVLEDATGGKVDIGHVDLNVWHLAVEVDGLVIHGLEGPGEAPYLAADKIFVRIKLVNLLAHTAGGATGHIGLNLLRIEGPRVHLIVDKEGRTNQPVPKKKTQSNEPVIDTPARPEGERG